MLFISTPFNHKVDFYMKKIISLISFLLALSFSFVSPLYAAAHEKKVEDSTAETTEASAEEKASNEEKTDNADSDDKKKKKDGEAKEEDEEPDCD